VVSSRSDPSAAASRAARYSHRVPGFRDHFSGHADQYARWRPGYPEELYRWLSGLVERHDLAWDCATGSGQAARGLAPFFGRVVATDASIDQLANRGRGARVRTAGESDDEASAARIGFHAAEASASALAGGSVDLVCVAQALHWFDLGPFEAEVRRVLRPGGVLAAWTYERFRVVPAIDALMTDFAERTVGSFWPPERRHVDAGYATLELSFDLIEAPAFVMRARWTLDELLAYVGTWSAVRRFWKARGFNPVADLEVLLEPLWGRREDRREITWRLATLVGRR
jgi:SAM-dependent methyltransferase